MGSSSLTMASALALRLASILVCRCRHHGDEAEKRHVSLRNWSANCHAWGGKKRGTKNKGLNFYAFVQLFFPMTRLLSHFPLFIFLFSILLFFQTVKYIFHCRWVIHYLLRHRVNVSQEFDAACSAVVPQLFRHQIHLTIGRRSRQSGRGPTGKEQKKKRGGKQERHCYFQLGGFPILASTRVDVVIEIVVVEAACVITTAGTPHRVLTTASGPE